MRVCGVRCAGVQACSVLACSVQGCGGWRSWLCLFLHLAACYMLHLPPPAYATRHTSRPAADTCDVATTDARSTTLTSAGCLSSARQRRSRLLPSRTPGGHERRYLMDLGQRTSRLPYRATPTHLPPHRHRVHPHSSRQHLLPPPLPPTYHNVLVCTLPHCNMNRTRGRPRLVPARANAVSSSCEPSVVYVCARLLEERLDDLPCQWSTSATLKHHPAHRVLVNVRHIVPAVVEPLERGNLGVNFMSALRKTHHRGAIKAHDSKLVDALLRQAGHLGVGRGPRGPCPCTALCRAGVRLGPVAGRLVEAFP
jgi:hypothetical protein